MIKIVAISDTHMQHWPLKLPSGDVLIHAGDACIAGSVKEWVDFSEWWNLQDYAHKVFVPGNHDRQCEERPEWAESLLLDTHFLIDKGVTIEGINFWGTPWQKPFHNWAFNAEDAFRFRKFGQIPRDTEVLISHTPPFGVQDVVDGEEEHLGDKPLLEAAKKTELLVHIFGHIHSGYGVGMYLNSAGWAITSANASICNEGYRPVNVPLTLRV